MDLKHFHYVFIAVSILCTLGFGFWAMTADVRIVGSWGRAGGLVSALLGVLLSVYGVWFVRKSRQIIT